MILILDAVIADIQREIAAHEPERGGALLGPVGWPIVTTLLPDPEARTSWAAYNASERLFHAIPEMERSYRLECKGIIHSHPGTLDHPSSPDRTQVATALGDNLHLAHFLVPIVTCKRQPGVLAPHEIPLIHGKISFFSGARRPKGRVEVLPMTVSVIPLQRDMLRLASVFGATSAPTVGTSNLAEGMSMPSATLQLPGFELIVMVSDLYPAMPPIVLLTPDGGDTEQLPITWRLEAAQADRLIEALSPFISPPGPYRVGFGPAGVSPLTDDRAIAKLAGWQRRVTREHPAEAAGTVVVGLGARSNGIASQALNRQRVLVVGTGSVGSFAAEQLVRAGIGGISLVDADVVELPNLSRTTFELRDVGQPKVDALARRLLNINPTLAVVRKTSRLQDLALSDLDQLFMSVDVVMAATDDPDAQRLVNRFAYGRGKPSVFVGVYAGARGGEVVIAVPTSTACYLCATNMRHVAESEGQSVSGKLDYGTGRLTGEIALASDIHHLSTAAVKCLLALALSGDAESSLSSFLRAPLNAGQSYLTMSMVPDFWFYPNLFGQTPGQYAYQSVWLKPERNPECSVCGGSDYREDPLSQGTRVPRSESFDEHLARRGESTSARAVIE